MTTIATPASLETNHSLYFSCLFNKPVRAQGRRRKLGRASDLVFALQEPLPKVVGLFIDHGWGKPTEFIPWHCVKAFGPKGIEVLAPEGEQYPPFQDQPGWILLDKHLMGRTILDIDDRQIEVVNDVLLHAADGTLLLTAVDASFNGWLRKWGLSFLQSLIKDDLIPWKWVQPLSVEDAISTDRLQLSVTKAQLHDIPKEDLADALGYAAGSRRARTAAGSRWTSRWTGATRGPCPSRPSLLPLQNCRRVREAVVRRPLRSCRWNIPAPSRNRGRHKGPGRSI